MEKGKEIILSGIQPSGVLTLGNYLGALKNWVAVQNDYECIFFVADMHSITVPQNPKTLLENTKSVVAQYAACGVDFASNVVFLQSQVLEHSALGWILNCSTGMGELSRMTQFKEKSKKQQDASASVGLFDYPVLMAADILLYNTDLVPVGDDQRQHLELARNLAQRFNSRYGVDTFKIPEGFIPKSGARIMSLQDPTKKMAKSDPNPNSYILLLDSKDEIMRKFRKAVTDSGSEIYYSNDKPGIKNLLDIYSSVTSRASEEVEKEFRGCSYGELKEATGEVVYSILEPIQEHYANYINGIGMKELSDNLACGIDSARELASKKLAEVYSIVGFWKGW